MDWPTTVQSVADHPWGYLAEVMCGSQGPAAEHQLQFWEEQGFRNFELEKFATLAGPVPVAEPWNPGDNKIKIQVRGRPESVASHAWIQHCPLESKVNAALEIVPLGCQGLARSQST